MAQKRIKPKERQIGKKVPEKKHLIDPRYKNTFWTGVVLVILLIFFIVNNTRETPARGPYPPGYNPSQVKEQVKDKVPPEVDLIKDSIKVKE